MRRKREEKKPQILFVPLDRGHAFRGINSIEPPAHKFEIDKRRFEVWGCGQGRNRTADTRIFSPLLYRLSYLSVFQYVI